MRDGQPNADDPRPSPEPRLGDLSEQPVPAEDADKVRGGNTFLRIAGIKGESTSSGHGSQIEVISWPSPPPPPPPPPPPA